MPKARTCTWRWTGARKPRGKRKDGEKGPAPGRHLFQVDAEAGGAVLYVGHPCVSFGHLINLANLLDCGSPNIATYLDCALAGAMQSLFLSSTSLNLPSLHNRLHRAVAEEGTACATLYALLVR